MRSMKKLMLIPMLALMIVLAPKAKAQEECFEGVSRAIFKFNMALDDIILEPLAKV